MDETIVSYLPNGVKMDNLKHVLKNCPIDIILPGEDTKERVSLVSDRSFAIMIVMNSCLILALDI